MIKEEETGAKIAENKDEAFWVQLKEKLNNDNDSMNRSIEINNFVLKLVEDKLNSFP